MSYLAILVGALLWYALGAVWYMLLSKPWMAAAGITQNQARASGGPGLFITTFIATLIGALLLNEVYSLADVTSLMEAARLGIYIGLGMGGTIVVLNTLYGLRGKALIWIDGGFATLGGLLVFLARFFIAG